VSPVAAWRRPDDRVSGTISSDICYRRNSLRADCSPPILPRRITLCPFAFPNYALRRYGLAVAARIDIGYRSSRY